MAAAANLHKEWPTMEKDMEEFGAWMAERYGEDMMGWIKSEPVQAVENHKKLIMHSSREMHQLFSDAYTLYAEYAHHGDEMGWGFNEDGSYTEW